MLQNRPTLTDSAFILDLEGVLIDSEFRKRLAFVEATEHLLNKETEVQEFAWTLGRRREDVIAGLNVQFQESETSFRPSPDSNKSVGQELLEVRDQILLSNKGGKVDLMPGAAELLDLLEEHRVPSAFASSTYESVANEMLRAANIPDRLPVQIFGDTPEVIEGKPSPNIFLVAARRLAVSVDKCWVVEDAAAGIEAAHRAKMHSVYIPDARIGPPSTAAMASADITLNSLEELCKLLRD